MSISGETAGLISKLVETVNEHADEIAALKKAVAELQRQNSGDSYPR